MANLLKSSEIATLFLDNELRIKFFTPAMTRVLNLIPADMGRPLTHLSMDLIGCDLAADARAVAQGRVRRRTKRCGTPTAPPTSCASCPTARKWNGWTAWSLRSST